MNQIVEYVASVPKINNVIFVGGKECDKNIIKDLIKVANIDSISLYISNKKTEKEIKEQIEQLTDEELRYLPQTSFYEIDEIYSLSEISSDTVLWCDKLDNSNMIFKLKSLKPKYLCGYIEYGSVTTFEIWEEFRNCTEEIHLISYGVDRRDEVLHWKKNEKSNIELSVILPMYNIAKYLPKCIETVTAWKAEYIEFLFVDDGSPDNCAEIVEKATQKDSRIKLIRKENGGCASARQCGLDIAKGRYVGFIDPDDFIDESMYRKLLRRAFMGNYDISYSGYKELYEATGEVVDVMDIIGHPYSNGTCDRNLILSLVAHRRIAIWRGIYKKEMIDTNNIHFYTDLRRFDDLPFKVETLAVAKSVVTVPEYLYYYRMERPGQDVAANDERLYVHFQIFEYLDEFARRTGSKELIEMIQVIKLQTHIYAIEKLLPKYIPSYVKNAKKDLLKNIGYFNSSIIYKSNVSKTHKAYFNAIVLGGAPATKLLCSRLEKHKHKNVYITKSQLKTIDKLTKL